MARLLAVPLAFVLLGAGCSEPPERDPTAAPTPQRAGTIVIEGETANDAGTYSVAGSETLEMTAREFAFSPTLVLGPPDLAVEIDLVAEGGGTHSFTLPEEEIDQDVAGGETVRISTRFPDTGTIVFFCKYHRERGMVGGLTAA